MAGPSDRDQSGTPLGGAPDDQFDDILGVIEDLKRQLKNSKDMSSKLSQELQAAKGRMSEVETKLGKQAEELDRTTRLLSVCQAENETLISEAIAGQEDQHEAAREIHRLRQEASASREKLRGLEQEMDRLKKARSEATTQATAREEPLLKRVQELEQELEARTDRLEELGREVRRLNVAVSDLSKEKAQLQAQVEMLERYRQAMSRIHGALRGSE